jgi:hypothetical protein
MTHKSKKGWGDLEPLLVRVLHFAEGKLDIITEKECMEIYGYFFCVCDFFI